MDHAFLGPSSFPARGPSRILIAGHAAARRSFTTLFFAMMSLSAWRL